MKSWEQIVLKEDFFKQIAAFQKPCTANQELKLKKTKINVSFNLQTLPEVRVMACI